MVCRPRVTGRDMLTGVAGLRRRAGAHRFKAHGAVLYRVQELPHRMAKIVIASLKSKSKPGGRGRPPVAKKRVRDTDGRVKTLWTLDLGSATFGQDLQYVFGRNVAKARQDNKRAIGVPDVAIKR